LKSDLEPDFDGQRGWPATRKNGGLPKGSSIGLKPPYLASRREAAMGCTDNFISLKMLTSEPKTGKIDSGKQAVSFQP
jgi:hypothetical protein